MSKPNSAAPASAIEDDDEEWQTMPVESSFSNTNDLSLDSYSNPNDLPYGDEEADLSDPDDSHRFRSWGSRSNKTTLPIHSKTSSSTSFNSHPRVTPARHTFSNANTPYSSSGTYRRSATTTNATGKHLDIDDARGYNWRSKPTDSASNSDDEETNGNEKGYTQVRLDEDQEAEQLHAATEYLFQDGAGATHDPYSDAAAATPLSQMKTTKQLLSEGQKIAYVGLCSLTASDMVKTIARVPAKGLKPAKESVESWKVKVMARLYQHMDIESSEQNMIESLSHHGVLPTDLAPSLVTTQTINNPDFDPEALRERQEKEKEKAQEKENAEIAATRANVDQASQLSTPASDDTNLDASRTDDSTQKQIPELQGQAVDTILQASEKAIDIDAPSVSPKNEHAQSTSESFPGSEEDTSQDVLQTEAEDLEDDGDLGDLGSSAKENEKKKSNVKLAEASPKTPSVNQHGHAADQMMDEFDGDIGITHDGQDLSQNGKTPSNMADLDPTQQQGEPLQQEQPHDENAKIQTEPPQPPPRSDSLPEKRPSRQREASNVSNETPKEPILADPNTASQLSNAIDATSGSASVATVDPSLGSSTTTLGLTKQPQVVQPPPSALDGVTTSISSADETITLDLRWTVLCDLFLVLTADSVYDSRSRVLLEKVAAYLGLAWMDVTQFEKRVTDALEIEEGIESLKDTGTLKRRMEMARNKRLMMMGLATVGGGLIIGLSAGLLAPVIGAGVGAALGAVGISGTSGFLGGVGGAALITTTGTVGGMSLGGRGMSRRTRGVSTFEFKPIHNNKRVNAIIGIPGFMSGRQDDVRLPFSVIDSIMGDVFSVLWEPDMMRDMGNSLGILWNETLVQGVQQVLAATVAGAMFSALAWPLWLTKLGYLIDNPWSNALDRSRAAGYVLADILSKRQLGVRPITLVGFSLGARVIFYALIELNRMKAFGIVQNVYMMGAPVTAPDEMWKEARSVVAGRFVSAFSRSDWILGYLHRAASGGLRSIAGLHPVERVQDIENIDVTHVIPGHLAYRSLLPLVLSEIGFRTTADYFDEPEDPSKIPEREIVCESDDKEEMKTVKTKTGGFGKIFRKNGSTNDKSGSSSLKSTPPSTAPMSPSSSNLEIRASQGGTPNHGQHEYSYDESEDEDLPPRIEDPKRVEPADLKATFAEAGGCLVDERTLPDSKDKGLQPTASNPYFDTEGILAELRESGIQVKELESSLPPLVASAKPHDDVTATRNVENKLEMPTPAFSSDRMPSPSANLAASQSSFQAPAPALASPSMSRKGSTAMVDEVNNESVGSSRSESLPPYPKAFSSNHMGSVDSSFGVPFSESAADLSAMTTCSGGVSLTFASFDDEYIETQTIPNEYPNELWLSSDDKLTAYGISSSSAKELKEKFRNGSTGLGPDVAGQAASNWADEDTPWNREPLRASTSESDSMGSLRPSKVDIPPTGRPYESSGSSSVRPPSKLSVLGSDGNSSVPSGGLGSSPSPTFVGLDTLTPPSSAVGRGFNAEMFKAQANIGPPSQGYFSGAAVSLSPRRENSLLPSATGTDPWSPPENPWGGGEY